MDTLTTITVLEADALLRELPSSPQKIMMGTPLYSAYREAMRKLQQARVNANPLTKGAKHDPNRT